MTNTAKQWLRSKCRALHGRAMPALSPIIIDAPCHSSTLSLPPLTDHYTRDHVSPVACAPPARGTLARTSSALSRVRVSRESHTHVTRHAASHSTCLHLIPPSLLCTLRTPRAIEMDTKCGQGAVCVFSCVPGAVPFGSLQLIRCAHGALARFGFGGRGGFFTSHGGFD